MPPSPGLGVLPLHAIVSEMNRFVAFCLLCAPYAFADTAPSHDAFLAGNFREAARLAQAEDTADSLAFAARSQLAAIVISSPVRVPLTDVEQAESLARSALDREPDHIEGRLQLAIALSLKARPLSAREALRSGHGETARDLVLSVLSDDPDNPYSHSFLAVWHIEVVRRGGRFGAALMGASLASAQDHYHHAIDIEPDDAAIHWQYARALAALNPQRHSRDIRTALDRALAAQSDTSLEATMRARAGLLLEALNQEPATEVRRLANTLL